MFLHYFPWLVAALCLAGFLASNIPLGDDEAKRLAHTIAGMLQRHLPPETLTQLAEALKEDLLRQLKLVTRLDSTEVQSQVSASLQALTQLTSRQTASELSFVLNQLDPAQNEKLRLSIRDLALKWTRGRSHGRQGIFLPPSNATYVVCHDGVTVMVLEEAPSVKTIRYRVRKHGEKKSLTSYTLSLPRLVYVLVFVGNSLDKLFLATCTRPLEILDDELYRLPIPNLYSDGQVCLGSLKEWLRKSNPRELAGGICRALWLTCFNDDLDFVDGAADSRLKSLELWAKASEENPDFVRECEYKPLGKLGDFVAARYDTAYAKLQTPPEAEFSKSVSKKAISLLRKIWKETLAHVDLLGTRGYPGTTDHEVAVMIEQAALAAMHEPVASSVASIGLPLTQALEAAITAILTTPSTAEEGGEQ